MMLYTRIAAEEPAGTEITSGYIMEKYGVSRSISQSAVRVLAKIEAVTPTWWRGNDRMAFRILPDAQEKVREYEELVAACRRGVKKVRCTDWYRKRTGPLSPNGNLYPSITGCLRPSRQSSGN